MVSSSYYHDVIYYPVNIVWWIKFSIFQMNVCHTILGLTPPRGIGLGCRGLMIEDAGLLGLVNDDLQKLWEWLLVPCDQVSVAYREPAKLGMTTRRSCLR